MWAALSAAGSFMLLVLGGMGSGVELTAAILGAVVLGAAAWFATAYITAARLTGSDMRATLDAVAIALTRGDGVIRHWSHGCETLYGWTAAEAVGRNKYELVDSRASDGTADLTSCFSATGERELIERRKDGTTINVIERRRSLARPGREQRVLLKMLNISERVCVESALRTSEAQLRSIMEATPNAMIVVDSKATIVEFSPAAERLWGYAAQEVVGRSALPLIAPEEHPRLMSVVTRRPEPDVHIPVRPAAAVTALARDGTRLSLEAYYGHARTASGYLITLFCRDISERLAAERRFAELNAELTHVARQSAMSELAADLAHELNQPLSATANFLAAARMLLDQGSDSARAAELLRMAEEQTLRSGAIIRRLRDFLAKRDAEMRAESIDSTVREAVDLVLFGAAQYDIHMVYALDPDADLVLADRIQIQQVLVNLLRNAIDALLHQPCKAREIAIASRATGDGMVEIMVSDSGPGLPPEVSEQLYSRFATTKSGTAMGIGLSISRRIVEAHGGTLIAGNRPQGGASFRFTLPMFEEIEE